MKTALTSLKFWLALAASVIFGLGATATRAHGAPELMVTSPAVNQEIAGQSVNVKLTVEEFALTDYTTHTKRVTGQGHIHLWLDQETRTKTSAIKTITDTYTFENVTPGEHTLVAELVNNDHSSLVPPVMATVMFTTVPAATQAALGVQSNTFMISILAFIMLVIALYFVNLQVKTTRSSGTPHQKSSRTSAKSKKRK